MDQVFVRMGETDERFRDMFISLRFILIHETIPKLHESYFSWCTIGEIFEGLVLEKYGVRYYFFMFDHEPVFCDVVFGF